MRLKANENALLFSFEKKEKKNKCMQRLSVSLLLSVVCLQTYVPIYSIILLHKFTKELFLFRFLLFVVWFCFISFRCVLIIFQTNAVTISIRLEFTLSQTFLGGKQRKRHGLNLVLLVSKRTTI